MPALAEWLDAALLAREKWPGFGDALAHAASAGRAHRPRLEGPAWSRLAYDEMLAGQLALALVRAHMRRRGGRARAHDARLQAKVAGGAAVPN